MSQTKQHEQVAKPDQPRTRKDWEWFWRIVAVLMLAFISWAGWVLYQITPRSVVTPLAYAPQVKPIGAPQAAGGAQVPDAQSSEVTAQPATAPAESGQASGVVSTVPHAATAKSAADIPAGDPAANQDKKDEQIKGAGLRLATEISTPLPAKQDKSTTQEDNPGRAPAGTAGAAKDRR